MEAEYAYHEQMAAEAYYDQQCNDAANYGEYMSQQAEQSQQTNRPPSDAEGWEGSTEQLF